MWESIHNNDSSTWAAQQLAKMREELTSIGEKERILRQRSADREAYRYLLDAHQLLARARIVGQNSLNISPPARGEGGQLAA